MEQILPEIYHGLIPKGLMEQKPQEKKATCGACPKAPGEYNPYLKCCTFHPFLANYLVGGY